MDPCPKRLSAIQITSCFIYWTHGPCPARLQKKPFFFRWTHGPIYITSAAQIASCLFYWTHGPISKVGAEKNPLCVFHWTHRPVSYNRVRDRYEDEVAHTLAHVTRSSRCGRQICKRHERSNMWYERKLIKNTYSTKAYTGLMAMWDLSRFIGYHSDLMWPYYSPKLLLFKWHHVSFTGPMDPCPEWLQKKPLHVFFTGPMDPCPKRLLFK
jgi:hypothetical protein